MMVPEAKSVGLWSRSHIANNAKHYVTRAGVIAQVGTLTVLDAPE